MEVFVLKQFQPLYQAAWDVDPFPPKLYISPYTKIYLLTEKTDGFQDEISPDIKK